MPLGILFWTIFIIALLFGLWSGYEPAQPLWYRRTGAYLVLWLLVGILGYHAFGPVVR